MPSPFSRTLRSLRGDRATGSLLALAGAALFLGLWFAWFVAAELPVYVRSDEARLEVEQAVHPVAAHTSGRIVEVRAAVGEVVTAGEVLFELDAELERRRLDEETSRHRALLDEIESLKRVRETEVQGLADARRAAAAAIEEARSRHEAEVAAAELAQEEAERSAKLHEEGLEAEIDLRRARAEAVERRSEAQALERSIARLESVSLSEAGDRQAKLDGIEREIAELEGRAETSIATARRLEEEIARRQILAPAAGRLGEVAKVRAGSVVAPGDHLATVIPTAALKVVAGFPPSDALARIRPGQNGQMRLDGFPWTEYGSLAVTVARVADEARDGKVWLDGAVAKAPGSLIPLQHGLPGILVVEVERLSPAEMVLRAAGRAVAGGSGRQASAAPAESR